VVMRTSCKSCTFQVIITIRMLCMFSVLVGS
jgi:hypothetical protein